MAQHPPVPPASWHKSLSTSTDSTLGSAARAGAFVSPRATARICAISSFMGCTFIMGGRHTSTGFGSTIFAAMIEISYSAISGSAKPDWVITSGGARIAATMNIPTQAYRR
jgi:hypothetical protein